MKVISTVFLRALAVASMALVVACSVRAPEPMPSTVKLTYTSVPVSPTMAMQLSPYHTAPAATPATVTADVPSSSATVIATPTQATDAESSATSTTYSTGTAAPIETTGSVAAATCTACPTSTATATESTDAVSAATPTPYPTGTPTATVAATSVLRLVAELPIGSDTLAFSSDDSLIALGNSQNELQVWSTGTWQRLWSGSHDDAIRRIAFSPDDSLLASVSFDHTARLWDVGTGDQIARLDFGYWVYGLDFSSDGHVWAAGSFDGKATIADTSSGQIIRELEHELMITSLDLSPDGPWMAVMTTGSWGPGRIVVWDTITQEKRILAEFQGPAYSNVVFNPDTTLLAAGLGAGGLVTLWHTQVWTEAGQLIHPGGIVNRLAFSLDGRHLAAAVSSGVEADLVVVWDVETSQPIVRMEQPDVLWDMAFSPDGRWVVTGLGQGIDRPPANEALLWEVLGGTMVAQMPHTGQVPAVAYSHDGQRIASAGRDSIKIWEFR